MWRTKDGVKTPITLLFNPQLFVSRRWMAMVLAVSFRKNVDMTDIQFRILGIWLDGRLTPCKVTCSQGESQSSMLGFTELSKVAGWPLNEVHWNITNLRRSTFLLVKDIFTFFQLGIRKETLFFRSYRYQSEHYSAAFYFWIQNNVTQHNHTNYIVSTHGLWDVSPFIYIRLYFLYENLNIGFGFLERRHVLLTFLRNFHTGKLLNIYYTRSLHA